MLSGYARNEWMTILAIGLVLTVTLAVVQWWVVAVVCVLATLALLSFFRDPHRRPPTQRGVVVAPADGRVSSIHELEHFEPLDGPATCIRIFLSVLDVHVNRSPLHGEVVSVHHKPGQYRNALNPESAEVNAATTTVLVHPIRRYPIAAVRQVSGMLARTIVCNARAGKVLQRGEKYGIIKLGSTTELYLPRDLVQRVEVQPGQKVKAGLTVVAALASLELKPGENGASPTPAEAPPPAKPENPATPADSDSAGNTATRRDSDGSLFEAAAEDASVPAKG
ncbi:MAG: phosphatidylserine decarboxylase [Phycisphaeraceae bacterium]